MAERKREQAKAPKKHKKLQKREIWHHRNCECVLERCIYSKFEKTIPDIDIHNYRT